MIQKAPGSFQVYWQDDARSILVADFPQRWSMDDVYPVLDHMADMMDDGADEQAIVFNLTGSFLPPDAGKHFRRLLSTRVIEHHSLKLAIAVTGGIRLADVTVNVFNRLHQLFHDFPLLNAETLSTALQTIAEYRAND